MAQATTHLSGDDAVLARRYADSLCALSEAEKLTDAVAADLRGLRPAVQTPEFALLTTHPRLGRAEMLKAVEAVAAVTKIQPLTRRFLSVLAQNKRLGLLGGMADAYLALLAAQRREFHVEVRAAKPLSDAQQKKLVARLGEWFDGSVYIKVQEDQTLLGGLTIRMGSQLIDASVRNKLDRLERQMIQQPSKGAA